MSVGQDVATIRSEWLPVQKLREAVRAIQEVVQHLEDLLGQGDAPARFFESSNLSCVADWATKQPNGRGRYRAAGNMLAWERRDGWDESVRIKGPPVIVLPSLGPLGAMRDAITGTSETA